MPPNVRALSNLLRRKAGLGNNLPVDLDAIVEWCGLRCDDVPLDGCLGVYVPFDGGGGILVKDGQYRGQRRFTVGHEIGHFAIPTHQGGALCLEEDVARPSSNKMREQEANDFAAELLMPQHLFSSDIRTKDPSFTTVKRLASKERYDVSMTACALRLVKLTREPCALVVSRERTVVWRWRSDSFNGDVPSGGDAVPAESCASAVFAGERPSDEPERVTKHAWLTAQAEAEEVLESTFAIPELGQVLSLVWVIGRE